MNRFARLRRHQEGFTLIELLVVVAIIAMLATLMLPKVFEAINTAKRDATKGELATISGALARYYLDNGKFPTTLKTLKDQSYVKASMTFKNKFDYFYLYAVNDTTSPSAFVLLDPTNKPTSATTFSICSDASALNQAPAGLDPAGSTKVFWKTGATADKTLNLKSGADCSTAVTPVPDTLSDWGATRKDLFTE